MTNKRGSILGKVLTNIILIGLVYAIFFIAVAGRVNGRDVKQQILEKQTALLIDSASPGMSFFIISANINGFVSDVHINNNRIFITVDGFVSQSGYPYFSRYSINIKKLKDGFLVSING